MALRFEKMYDFDVTCDVCKHLFESGNTECCQDVELETCTRCAFIICEDCMVQRFDEAEVRCEEINISMKTLVDEANPLNGYTEETIKKSEVAVAEEIAHTCPSCQSKVELMSICDAIDLKESMRS